LNPKVFYTGVGTAFPLYRQKFGKNTEGVMGIGGWSGDSPAIKDYLARHKASAANGAEPDRWASSVTYASLQMLAGDRTRRQDRPRRCLSEPADRDLHTVIKVKFE
jgi:branched-chain amino acid transport system substrate-binding protein